ncbi:MAG: sigma-54-dependent transcriptional regulator [bacterium]
MSLVLIVDDVPAMRDQYAYDIKRLGGHDAITATSGAEALQVLEREPVDCVILDLEMPGIDGFEVLKTLQSRESDIPVIVYTGTGNIDRCVRAMKLGAFNFIDKKDPTERVAIEVENALRIGSVTRENADLRRQVGVMPPLIGDSRAMKALKDGIARLAPIPSPVLILGESGSGKELVARELHKQSKRSRGPFFPVNCAALPENLVESELFGHEKGAFTGAEKTRKGAFEVATRGTLFLDEVGELPLAAQSKLLRVLEEQTVTRVGDSRPIFVDTRVVAATNRDLAREMAAGRFRNDLFFRLNVHPLVVPPLRERLSDVGALVVYFLESMCIRFGIRPKTISPEAIEMLKRYDWSRNNVRELRNAVERMIIACEGSEIGAEQVPLDVWGKESDALVAAGDGWSGTAAGGGGSTPAMAGASSGGLREMRSAAERQIILAALERNSWHITRTAAALGLSDHASLLRIMRRHKLKRG